MCWQETREKSIRVAFWSAVLGGAQWGQEDGQLQILQSTRVDTDLCDTGCTLSHDALNQRPNEDNVWLCPRTRRIREQANNYECNMRSSCLPEWSDFLILRASYTYILKFVPPLPPNLSSLVAWHHTTRTICSLHIIWKWRNDHKITKPWKSSYLRDTSI